jgi:hypothetical protein
VYCCCPDPGIGCPAMGSGIVGRDGIGGLATRALPGSEGNIVACPKFEIASQDSSFGWCFVCALPRRIPPAGPSPNQIFEWTPTEVTVTSVEQSSTADRTLEAVRGATPRKFELSALDSGSGTIAIMWVLAPLQPLFGWRVSQRACPRRDIQRSQNFQRLGDEDLGGNNLP